jgi:uncharacterized membrane protein HdeD (DUF308 family)
MMFPDPGDRWTYREVAETVRRRWLWMEILGALLIVLGIISLSALVIASLATTFLIGGLLIVAGIVQTTAAVAFWRRHGGSFALGIILGALCILAGLLCIGRPAAGLHALTLILGAYFIASGAARFLINVRERFPGWSWGVVSSLSELLLGVLTLAWWPNTSLFVLGTLLGIQLLCSGTTAFAVGHAVRKILSPLPEPKDVEHHHRPATRFQH